jgi:hypothetical protein
MVKQTQVEDELALAGRADIEVGIGDSAKAQHALEQLQILAYPENYSVGVADDAKLAARRILAELEG